MSFECLTFLEYMTSTVLCDKRDLKHGLDNVLNDLMLRLRSAVNLYPERAKNEKWSSEGIENRGKLKAGDILCALGALLRVHGAIWWKFLAKLGRRWT